MAIALNPEITPGQKGTGRSFIAAWHLHTPSPVPGTSAFLAKADIKQHILGN